MTARELAQAVIAELHAPQYNPSAAKHYRRLAIIDYAQACQRAPLSTPQQTLDAFAEAALCAETAVRMGADRESLEMVLAMVARHWTEKLTKGMN